MSISLVPNNPAWSNGIRRLTLEGRNDGPTNMARDAALLSATDEAVARLYDWDGAWVTLGRGQSPTADLRWPSPVPYAMRPTGGKAVLHGHDLTLGIAIDLLALAEGEPLGSFSRRLRAIYRRALDPLLRSLRACGVPAVLGEELGPAGATGMGSDCFLVRSPNDIVSDETGSKVCGVAMRVSQTRVLLQSSIPVSQPLIDPALVFAYPAPSHWVHLNRHKFAEALAQGYGLNIVN